jgi:hypothetical protein
VHHLEETRYRRRLSLAMVAYVTAMLWVWPLARTAAGIPLKVIWAIVPVLPVLYAIGLMARRIGASDEFEQRVHLLALGAAAASTATLSLIVGFLAAAGVLVLDGSVLIWVFPLIVLSYDAARWWWLVRHYGGTLACDGTSLRWRLGVPAGLSLTLVGAAWWQGQLNGFQASLLCALVLVVALLLRWRERARRVTGAH